MKNRLDSIALEIHNNRKSVIPDLTKEIENILHELGMNNSKFKINLLFLMNYIQMEGIQLNLNFLLIKVMNLKKLKKQLQVEKCQE